MTFDGPPCDRCNKTIPKPWNDSPNLDNGLLVSLSGGYGEFIDSAFTGSYDVVLCHECAHDLADFLGIDVHNWHAHSPDSGQHPDHHDR